MTTCKTSHSVSQVLLPVKHDDPDVAGAMAELLETFLNQQVLGMEDRNGDVVTFSCGPCSRDGGKTWEIYVRGLR